MLYAFLLDAFYYFFTKIGFLFQATVCHPDTQWNGWQSKVTANNGLKNQGKIKSILCLCKSLETITKNIRKNRTTFLFCPCKGEKESIRNSADPFSFYRRPIRTSTHRVQAAKICVRVCNIELSLAVRGNMKSPLASSVFAWPFFLMTPRHTHKTRWSKEISVVLFFLIFSSDAAAESPCSTIRWECGVESQAAAWAIRLTTSITFFRRLSLSFLTSRFRIDIFPYATSPGPFVQTSIFFLSECAK